MNRLLLSVPILFVLAACQPQQASETAPPPAAPAVAEVAAAIAVTDAWCRPTPDGARAGACYATLTASGSDDRLIGVSTPAAGMAMVHVMSTADGMMKMSEAADGLALPVGQAVTLAPGGAHLMLMDLKGPLVAGTEVSLTLDFAGGPDFAVSAPVRQPAA